MSQTPVFLRRETRVSTVVWSVICIITAIMLTLLALMLDNAKIAVVGSVVMALFLSFVHGITQLAVVRDYRAPHRYLSVDGILHICLTIVIALASVLYLVSQAILSAAESASSFDFRYVVAVFIFIVAAWQCCVAVIAFRGRHFNATLEALLALSYIASGIGVLGQSGFSDGAAADRFLLIADFVLCAVTLVYLLVSYVFRSPGLSGDGGRLADAPPGAGTAGTACCAVCGLRRAAAISNAVFRNARRTDVSGCRRAVERRRRYHRPPCQTQKPV